MQGLAEVVEAERGEHGIVVVTHFYELGGLTFYLDGAVEHIGRFGAKRGRTIQEFLSELRSRPAGWTLVVVGEAFGDAEGNAGPLTLHPLCRNWERWLRQLEAQPRVQISQGRFCVVSGTRKPRG
jgi:hypothetical protein